jgi:hypothetical protein
MSDIWLDYIDRTWQRFMELRKARGYKPIPTPEHLRGRILNMPNLYLAGVKSEPTNASQEISK